MEQSSRRHYLDALRGFAVLLMIAYHVSFDLNYFGWIHVDLNHERFWLLSRAFIVSLFLGVMGVSLQLAHQKMIRWSVVGKRFLILAGSALLVTLATLQLFPDSYIFFGILHFIALASLLGLLFLGRPRLAATVGMALLTLGLFWSHPLFDQPHWQWIGLMTHKPITEDYVPLIPWFGVVLLGIALAGRLPGQWSGIWEGGWRGALTGVGRHSLLIYLLHQPLLMGLLYLVTSASRA